MLKYFVAVFILIFGSLGAIYFWVGVSKVYEETEPLQVTPHLYQDPDRSVSEIKIFAFYFVPKNKTGDLVSEWRTIMEGVLQKVESFHALQFQGRSQIQAAMYPEPVIGLKESIEYDTESTQGGNPQALLRVAEELEQRVFRSDGDLARKDFSLTYNSAYPVLAIMYEGVGAVGGVVYQSDLKDKAAIAKETGFPEPFIYIVDIASIDGFFLINRVFLDEPEYKGKGESIFAHEFYHTLGIADNYETPGIYEVPTSSDIMGLGRFRPIEKTYLDKHILQQMGL